MAAADDPGVAAGVAVTDGRGVAKNGSVADGRGGMDWVRVSLWEELAEQMHDQLGRGDQVYVEGKLTLGQWTGQDGQPRSGLNVSAWKCAILGAVGRRETARVDQDAGDGRTVDLGQVELRQRVAAAAAAGTERAEERVRRGRR